MGKVIGPRTQNIANASNVTDIPVAGVATAYTKSRKIENVIVFGLSLKATVAAGVPDVDVYLEQSFQRPTTEGAADDTWKVPSGVAKLADLTNENWVHLSMSPVVLPYLRIRLDGQGVNPASCTVQVKLSTQEET